MGDQPKDGESEVKKGLKENPNAKQNANAEGDKDGEMYHHDTYWLKYSKAVIDQTLPNINGHIKSYSTFLDGLSFTTFLGGVALSIYFKSSNEDIFWYVVGPIIGLQFAKYLIKVIIGAPTLTDIDDPQDPDKVKDAHNKFVKWANIKLTIGSIIVGLATIAYLYFVPMGILKHNQLSEPDFKEYVHMDIDGETLVIRALLPDAAFASLEVRGKKGQDTVSPKLLDLVIDKNYKIESTQVLSQFDFTPTEIILNYQIRDQIKSYTLKEGKAATPKPGVNATTMSSIPADKSKEKENKAKKTGKDSTSQSPDTNQD